MHGLERYEIVRLLGRGGMGSVHLARDRVLDRYVAVKRLRAGVDDDAMRRRFEREARILAALQHPNVISVFDYFQHDGDPFLVMEYLEGETLRSVIAEQRPWSLARKLEVIEHLCDGLESVHKAGIIHRDVKPANLMLTRDGAIKLLDFGVAKTPETALTMPRMQVGSPNYMSPEQIRGDALDPRSDVFALTTVLYELVACTPPFPGDVPQAFHAILTADPVRLSALVPDVPARLDRLIDRGLAKRCEDRWSSVGHLALELRGIRQDLANATTRFPDGAAAPRDDRAASAVAPSIEIADDSDQPSGRRQLVAGLVACLLVAVVTGAMWLLRAPETAAERPANPAPRVETGGSEKTTPVPSTATRAPRASGRPAEGARRPADPQANRTREGDVDRVATPPPVGSAEASPPSTGAVQGSRDTGAVSANEPARNSDGRDQAAQAEKPPPDDLEVREVLAAFQRAHNARDVPAIKSLYPDLPQAEVLSLTRMFLDARDYTFRLSDVTIQQRGAVARVICSATRSYTPIKGEPRTVVDRLAIELRKSDDGWSIARVTGSR